MQSAVIEVARNVCGLENANSSEFDPDCAHQVVIDMPEHNTGQMGGTMRLGSRPCFLMTFFLNLKTVFLISFNSRIFISRHFLKAWF